MASFRYTRQLLFTIAASAKSAEFVNSKHWYEKRILKIKWKQYTDLTDAPLVSDFCDPKLFNLNKPIKHPTVVHPNLQTQQLH